MQFIKKYWQIICGFGMGLLTLFFFWRQKEPSKTDSILELEKKIVVDLPPPPLSLEEMKKQIKEYDSMTPEELLNELKKL